MQTEILAIVLPLAFGVIMATMNTILIKLGGLAEVAYLTAFISLLLIGIPLIIPLVRGVFNVMFPEGFFSITILLED